MEKWIQYAALIQDQIAQMFGDDCAIHINPQEFNEPENFKAFLHALSNVVPCSIFNKMSGEEKNYLEFNHLANHLVFEYSTKEEPAYPPPKKISSFWFHIVCGVIKGGSFYFYFSPVPFLFGKFKLI